MPFLLRVCAAPASAVSAATNEAGEVEMESESDEELEATAAEVEVERALADDLELHAEYWDNFLELVADSQADWAEDTNEYREQRAVSAFNLGTIVANNLITLNPLMLSWVPHILVFIVPQQILELGSPARRSCDACESFGAMAKKIIKHLTCRRGISSRFTKGYVQQTFERLCIRQSLIHDKENEPYLQRKDARLRNFGKQPALRKPGSSLASIREEFGRVNELISAPTVPTYLQEMAFMA